MSGAEDRNAPDAPDAPDAADAPRPDGAEQSAQAGQSARPQADPRPRPAYGEYAPEGWEWKPEAEHGAANGAPPSASSSAASSATAPSAAGPVSGVPHNLGVKGSSGRSAAAAGPTAGSATPGASSGSNAPGSNAPGSSAPSGTATDARGAAETGSEGAQSGPSPYRAEAPQPLDPASARAAQAAQARAAGAPAPKDRRGDRIVTIILLVIGGFGALYNALSLLQLPASLELIMTTLGSDADVPGWITTMSTISAVAMLALYAVTLIYSLQRLRARKLTFFVPLTAGVIAIVGVLGVSVAAMMGIPGFMELTQDPDAMNRVIESLLQTSGS